VSSKAKATGTTCKAVDWTAAGSVFLLPSRLVADHPETGTLVLAALQASKAHAFQFYVLRGVGISMPT
jgi:hypothetical protein